MLEAESMALMVVPQIAGASDVALSGWEMECSTIMKAIRSELLRRKGQITRPWNGEGPELNPDQGLAACCYRVAVQEQIVAEDEDGEVKQQAHAIYVSEPIYIGEGSLAELARLQSDWHITIDPGSSRHRPGHSCRVEFRRRKSTSEES